MTGPVDALLLLSFGGPDDPEDVMPFLENVTRGRGIPPERLEAVAEHYHHLGGRSPLNELNLEIVEHLRTELAARGRELPVYFGNRNWRPYLADTLRQMAADGVRSAAVFATSSWGGYSGCAQYQEDIAAARAEFSGDEGATEGPDRPDAGVDVGVAPTLYRLRQFHDHPLFVGRWARDLSAAVQTSRSRTGTEPRVVFTAHSVPTAADEVAGAPGSGGRLYSRQVREAAALVAAQAGVGEYDVVWQSRSGPPSVPWLEPDVVDHVETLAGAGTGSVVVCPIGFLSDHVEVVWDLDHELADRCAELGVDLTRCATPGPTPEFTELVLDLVRELETGTAGERLGEVPSTGCTRDGARCVPGCCPRVGRPARPETAPSSTPSAG